MASIMRAQAAFVDVPRTTPARAASLSIKQRKGLRTKCFLKSTRDQDREELCLRDDLLRTLGAPVVHDVLRDGRPKVKVFRGRGVKQTSANGCNKLQRIAGGRLDRPISEQHKRCINLKTKFARRGGGKVHAQTFKRSDTRGRQRRATTMGGTEVVKSIQGGPPRIGRRSGPEQTQVCRGACGIHQRTRCQTTGRTRWTR